MFAAAGNHVVALHREAIGALELPPELAPGDWRIATTEEIAAAGG
jgi:16S rRNA pseudouridine516 synthase